MTRARALIALEWTLRLGLAALFLFAGLAKLRDPEAFAREIANYQFLPALAPHLAAALPATECIAALALLVPDAGFRRAAALVVVGLLGMFLVAVVSVLLRGVNVDCGCFGSGSGSVTWWTVLRNLTLTAAALYLVFDVRAEPPRASGSASGAGRAERVDERSVGATPGAAPEVGAGSASEAEGRVAGGAAGVRLGLPG